MSKKNISFKHIREKLFNVVIVVTTVAATFAPIGAPSVVKADGTVSTTNQVQIYETISDNGFVHPGIGLTKSVLENARDEVQAQHEPWYTYYQQMAATNEASKTVTASNQSASDPTKPANVAFNNKSIEGQFKADALKAYSQALMYIFTGDETYRANAMRIIRLWERLDPAQFSYYADALIHTGYPLNQMATAAELMRYTSYQTASLAWTDLDTANISNNLLNPGMNTFAYMNDGFMNQNNYAIVGAISVSIFTNNRDAYNNRVEWYTVNSTSPQQGFSGGLKQLFRLVDTNADTGEILDPPVVENVEMGRDQAHGADDLIISNTLPRIMMAQGTKVDPVAGTASTAGNAVGPYEFLNDRVLKVADYFSKYMLGEDVPWAPVPYVYNPDGTVKTIGSVTGIYHKISDLFRGRFDTMNDMWDLYYYYTYVRGVDVSQVAPYYYEAFLKRFPATYYFRGTKYNHGPESSWLYIPKAAESEGAQFIPKSQDSSLFQIEDRYHALDNHAVTRQEGTTTTPYVDITATQQGTKLVLTALTYADRTKSTVVGLKFRTNGMATLQLSRESNSAPYVTLTLPNTNSQWQYITFDMGVNHVSYGQVDDYYSLAYANVIGNGTNVDMDYLNLNVGTQLTPPVFKIENSNSSLIATDLSSVTYVGAPMKLDLSASDSSSTDVVSYTLINAPQGAAIDPGTGGFSWQPTQSGTYSFIVLVSDGTTIATRKVTIVVTNNRTSALQAAIAPYNPNKDYVAATLNSYQAAYNTTVSQMNTATDVAFAEQLVNLMMAADSLGLLTPLLSDGSMDYTQTVVASTPGAFLSTLVDGNNNTYPWRNFTPDLNYILDFGPDYKISASAFAMQGRMNFEDVMAGSVVYGSNDKATWTRLTPGETAYVTDMSSIAVDDAYKNSKYRFIKIQKIDFPGDMLGNNSIRAFEPSELRIYGQRYDAKNKIASVLLSSNTSVSGRIAIGATAKLTITAKEAIQNVKVKIQGVDATISTTDNINFTATAVMAPGTATGSVQFTLNYDRNDGTAGETTVLTTDNSKLSLVDDSDLINNVTSIANLIDSTTGRTAAVTLQQVNTWFDSDATTYSDIRNGGSGSGTGSYMTFDFHEGTGVTLSSIEVLGWSTLPQYVGRIAGVVAQGSNDNTNWTTLTSPAVSTVDWQTLPITGATAYRYIRIYNPNTWYGNMSELRLHGAVKTVTKISAISISSPQSINKRIVPGNTVNVSFTSTEQIGNANVTIQGQQAMVSSSDNIQWTAVATMNQGVAPGTIKFNINYNQQDGAAGYSMQSTTDSSSLFLVDESDVIKNVTSIANLIDSTTGRTAAATLQQVNTWFDGNATTYSDIRNGGSGNGTGSYMTFDFHEGTGVTLSSIEVLAWSTLPQYVGRIAGVVAQGSNDNTNWTTLTSPAISTVDWQTLPITGSTAYRYIRIYNPNTWYGNMSELRLHGAVKTVTKISAISISSPQSINKRIVPGNTVNVSFTSTEQIGNANVTIQGQQATVSSPDNIHWTAVATMNQGVAPGTIKFNINYNQQDGAVGYSMQSTTDSSSLFLVDESDVIKNVYSIANLIDSTTGRTAAATLQQVNNLLDGNATTYSDFRNGGSGSGTGSYITFDFKQANQATLSSVEVLAWSSNVGRVAGLLAQGSNDNTNWTMLTSPAVSTVDWQTLPTTSSTAYRYIRIYNPNTWYGNMSELRLHGTVN